MLATDFWQLESKRITHKILYQLAEVSGLELASYVSIVVFIRLNLACFITVVVFYIEIFQTATRSSQTVQSTAQSNELRMVIKMSAIVLTDFMCWVPLAFVCLLVQCGAITVGPDMYSWTVGLILPINSALNPFLYTLAGRDHIRLVWNLKNT